MHRDSALLAIQAGKATLVEKPFTINAAEARELIDAAKAQGTFLMEAMWTRFLPHVVRIRELVAAGRLGELRSMTADHGQWFPTDPTSRLFAPELGGGALLDLGIYPLSFASMLFGTPSRVTAVSDKTMTGVDAQTAVVLQYSGGRQSVSFTTLETRSANTASINGRTPESRSTASSIPRPASASSIVTAPRSASRSPTKATGCGTRRPSWPVPARRTPREPDLTLDETLWIMETLDEVRRQIGLRYPTEV